MPDLNNPKHLLRLLAALDTIIVVTSVYIPAFSDESLLDYIYSIKDMSVVYAVSNVLWLTMWVGWALAWMLMLCGHRYGRHMYMALMFIGMTVVYLSGIPRLPGGLLAVMASANGWYYGFVVCMLYFGPLSSVFSGHETTTQQVDAAEASTIAVRPSDPSGSPR